MNQALEQTHWMAVYEHSPLIITEVSAEKSVTAKVSKSSANIQKQVRRPREKYWNADTKV